MKSILIYSSSPKIIIHCSKFLSRTYQIVNAKNKIQFAQNLQKQEWDVLFFDDAVLPNLEKFIFILDKKNLLKKSIFISDKKIMKSHVKQISHRDFQLLRSLDSFILNDLKKKVSTETTTHKSIDVFKDEIIVRRKVAEDIENLPLFSNVIYQILNIIKNPKSSTSEFENIFSRDQVLMAKILSFSNSAFVGASSRINSIPRAITMIGYETLSNIVISYSFKQLIISEVYYYGFENLEYINYSIYCGIAARVLAKLLGHPREKLDGFYIGGLLHNIGYLILDSYLKEIDAERFKIDEENILVKEQNKLSIDHQQVGKMIIEKWKLSNELIDMITYHHNFEESENEEIPKIIYFSSIIAKAVFFELEIPDEIDKYFWENKFNLEKFTETIKDEYIKVTSVVGK